MRPSAASGSIFFYQNWLIFLLALWLSFLLTNAIKWTQEALFNILDNAVKYSPRNSVIKITVDEEQIDVFHKIIDCVSDNSAAEMSDAYKVGFKDSVTLMKEIHE